MALAANSGEAGSGSKQSAITIGQFLVGKRNHNPKLRQKSG